MESRNQGLGRPLAFVLVATCSSSACGGADPIEYEPLGVNYETSRVRLSADRDVCAGDLELLDATILELEHLLGGSGERKHTVYLYDRVPPQCVAGVGGCYIPELDLVATQWAAVEHELVHSVFAHRYGGFSERFWSEGLAEAMSRSTADELRHGASMAISRPATDYTTAAHMTNWVIWERGLDVAVNLVLGVPPTLLFGEGILSLEHEYKDAAAYAYPSAVADCPGIAPAVPAIGDGRWGEAVDVSCDSPDVSAFGSFARFSIARHLRVVRGATYVIRVEGDGHVLLHGCVSEPLEMPVNALDNGDIPMELDLWFVPVPSVAIAESGEETVLRAGFDGIVKIYLEVDDERDRIEYEISRL
jgi:hypothetical protein